MARDREHGYAVSMAIEQAIDEVEVARAAAAGAQREVAEDKIVRGMTFNNMTTMIPWPTALVTENRRVLGEDWWPYGIRRNRAALDTFLRYHYEQGLSSKRWAIEDVFVPYLLDD